MNKIYEILFFCLLPITLFSQTYYFNSIYPSNSGTWSALNAIIETETGYLAGGSTGNLPNSDWHQINLIVLDYEGDKVSEYFIGDTFSEYYIAVRSLINSNDSEIIFTGTRHTYFPEFPHDEALLIKLDNEYDTLWSKFIGELELPYDSAYNPRALIETHNNKLIIAGTMTPAINFKDNVVLIKTDEEGNKLSEWLYSYPGSDWKLRGFSVIETPDKGFAVGAYRFKPGYPNIYTGEPMVYKVDSLGSEEWHIDIGSPYYDDITILCNAHDGNIIAATCTADSMSGTEDAYRRINIKKIDLEGNIIWDKKYGNSRLYHYIGNIRPTNDGGYIITGSICTVGLPIYLPWESGWIFKINENGDSLWYRYKYNINGNYDINYLYDIIPAGDNGFAACGEVFGPSTNYIQHSWVVKVDSMGCDTPGCATGTTVFELPAITPEQLWIYPNPTTGMFNVLSSKFEVKGTKIIRIYNMQGLEVEEIEIPDGKESITINSKNWSKGIYLVQLVSDGEQVTCEKLIIK